jgi:hypothetical protein
MRGAPIANAPSPISSAKCAIPREASATEHRYNMLQHCWHAVQHAASMRPSEYSGVLHRRRLPSQVVFLPSVRARTKRHIMEALRLVERTQPPRAADGAASFPWQRRMLSWRQWRSCLLCNTGK